ncbi:MAG: PAS domain S-box protein, partial [Ignavibacteriales bacterium]|nr:PAS domain S-box protein [Ignavibacteriales bacterium]
MKKPLQLIVLEDSPIDVELLYQALQKEKISFTPTLVKTKRDFVQALKDSTPDIIISDFQLGNPTFDGMAAFLLAKELVPSVPFIILTGSMNEETAVECMKAGVSDYVTKGHINRIVPAIKSVLGQREVKDSLRLSEEYLRNIFESSLDMIITVDKNRHIVEFNRAAEEIFGYTRKEVLGKHVSMLYADSDQGQKVYTTTLANGRCVEEIVNRKKNGETFSTFLSASVLHNAEGELLGFMGISRDVSDIKRAEETKQASEKKFRTLFENSPIGIVMLDEYERVLHANKSFETIFHYTLEEMLGKNIQSMILPEHFSEEAKLFSRLTNEGKTFDKESVRKRKDGSLINVHVFGVPINIEENHSQSYRLYVDITFRKQWEEQLKESESRYRLLFESNPEPMWVYDFETLKFLAINDAAVFRYGYTREEFLSMTIKDIRPEGEVPKLTEHLRQIFPDKLNVGQFHHRTKSGAVIDVEISAHPIDFAGRKARIIIAKDITEQKKAELTLLKLSDQRKQLLEASETFLSTLSLGELLDRIIQSLKTALHFDVCALYWLDEEENVLRPSVALGAEWITEKFSEWIIPLGQGILSDVVRSGKSELVNNAHLDPRSIYPPGTKIPCEHLVSIPVRTKEKNLGVINIVRNADPEFTAEEFEWIKLFMSHASLSIHNALLFEQTKISEERYRNLFEESKDGIFISTPGGQLVDVNPAGVELFGYDSKEELLEVNIAKDLYSSSTDREKVKQRLEQQGFVKDFEFSIKRKDGQRRTVLETSIAVRNQKGAVVAYRGILRDITEQKKLEQQLLQAQKMESIGTLAGGIAHDFNNLLGIIMGYSSLLERQKSDPAKFSQSVDSISKAVSRGASLVKQLLTFARKNEPLLESVNLNSIFEELKKMTAETFPKTITCVLHLEKQIPSIVGDTNQLHQAFLNLCVNARDAMPKGGTLSLSTSILDGSKLRERFFDATDASYVRVSLSDTGTGMDEATRTRIFEPFFTTKERGRGTGLGLAVVYGIVKSHHGFI